MRLLVVVPLVIVFGSLASDHDANAAVPGAQDAAKPQSPEAVMVSFPTAGVTLLQPNGFTKADRFDGFGQEASQSSIMLTKLPAPYEEFIREFTPARMKEQGWTVLSREAVTLGDLPGVLFQFEQLAVEVEFQKWAVVFGDASQTNLVVASYPKTLEATLSSAMKTSVMSTRRDASAPAPGASLPFEVTASANLKIAAEANKSLLFTKDGTIGKTPNPRDPLFVVAPSIAKVKIAKDPDIRQITATRRLAQTSHTKEVIPTSMEPITVDGLDGFVGKGEGKDATSGVPIHIYQVMLFEDDAYILMVGIVGSENAEKYLPEFEAMARSFHRKPR